MHHYQCLLAIIAASSALPQLPSGSKLNTQLPRGVQSALSLRGGNWPRAPITSNDAWSKQRAAGREIGRPQKPTLRQQSYEDVVDAKPLDELLDRDSRVVFVRRVYGLLTANLALTAISCLYCSTHHNLIRNILLGPSGPLLMGLCVATGLGASLAVSFAPKLRSSIPLFTLFACAESVLVGVAASAFKARSVLLALAQTGTATAALTAWTLQPNQKYDLTQFGSMLFAGLMVLLVSAVMGTMMHVPQNSLVGSTVGALLFSAFIVHDTQLIVGGKKRQFDTNDYVLGAMSLYMDIVNLFLYLLRLFGELQDDRALVPR